MKRKFYLLFCIVLLMLAVGCSNSATKENKSNESTYPEKSPKSLVGYAAGGASDIVARLVANYLEPELGKSVTVINKEGAGGELAYTELANSKSNGYTLGYINAPATLSIPLNRKANYELDDFEFIGNVIYHENLIVVNPDGPYETFDDLVEAAEENPGKITVGNSGAYADDHLASLKLQHEVDIKFKDTMFEGTAPSLVALKGKHIDAVICNVADIKTMSENGEVNVIATMGEEENPLFEDAPTLKNLGFDVIMGNYTTLAVPKETPDDVLDTLRNSLESVVNSEEFMEAGEEAGLPIQYYDHEEISDIYKKSNEDLKNLWEELDLPTDE